MSRTRTWALVGLAVAAFAPASAHAAVLNVTKTADTADGTCDADCSLREAVIAANAPLSGPDAIVLPAGHYVLTIAGSAEDASATGDLDFRDDTTVTGAGAGTTSIDAGGDSGIGDRVLDVLTNGSGGGLPVTPSVTITGATITGGRLGAGNGGGAHSNGNLTLDHVIVSGNTAAVGEGGGVVEDGGGTTLVTVRDSTVSGNQAAFGGGVSENGGANSLTAEAGVVIERSTISGNTATRLMGNADGGGVIEDGAGNLRIRDSVVSGNTAEGTSSFGGGVSTDGGGTDTISNTTISGNTVNGTESFGGGFAENGGSTVTLTNVTIADNQALGTGSTPQHQAGNIAVNGGVATTFQNSIVTGGAPVNCVASSGTIASGGHNIENGSSCGFSGAGDQPGIDPLIGALADNGGPTQTRRLLPGSPAIDAGDNALCPSADQRGVSRPQPTGGVCDIGAVERLTADLNITNVAAQPTVTTGSPLNFTITVTNSGPGDASGVTVSDALPAGLSLVSIASSAGTCTQVPAPACDIGALGSGASAQVTVVAAAAGPGTFDNTAQAAQGPLADDPNLANNQATAQVIVTEPGVDPPVLGKSFNAEPVKGTVLVSTPKVGAGRAAVAHSSAALKPPRGFTPFRPLATLSNIPVGSLLDASRGIVRLTMATSKNGTGTQVGQFSKGAFQTKQGRSSRLTTTTMMGGGNFKRDCKAQARKTGGSTARKRPRRQLFSNVRGRFRTRGRNSTATVRGTQYLVKDTCAGTLTSVRKGSVVVLDLVKHKRRVVKAGHSYLARPKAKRRR